MTIAKADYIEGLAKGLAVLEAFDTERQRLNATLAAQRTGITRAAARRHLLTLADLGYLTEVVSCAQALDRIRTQARRVP